MEIDDRVYGKIQVTEPVLLEIMQSQPVQRLKGIYQAGISIRVIPKLTVTRFEHSVGVMYLLQKLGASVEEQIAGLLHDVPHTAFSHVVDYVFRSKEHDFHEKFHEKIITESEVPIVLKKYGFAIDRILDEKNFPLLERSAPDLCADRVDYTLRDGITHFEDTALFSRFLGHFVVQDNEIIMNDAEMAKRFAELYIDMDKARWANPLEIVFYEIMAKALRIGLDEGIITEEDLFEVDDYVYNKLKNSGNKDILEQLAKINPNLRIVEDKNQYDYVAKAKLRFIDPKFVANGKIERVSERFPDFKERLLQRKKESEEGKRVKIVSW